MRLLPPFPSRPLGRFVSRKLRAFAPDGYRTSRATASKIFLAFRHIAPQISRAPLNVPPFSTHLMNGPFVFFAVSFLCTSPVISHGGRQLYEVVEEEKQQQTAEEGGELARDHGSSRSGKSFTQPATEERGRWWDVSLSSG